MIAVIVTSPDRFVELASRVGLTFVHQTGNVWVYQTIVPMGGYDYCYLYYSIEGPLQVPPYVQVVEGYVTGEADTVALVSRGQAPLSGQQVAGQPGVQQPYGRGEVSCGQQGKQSRCSLQERGPGREPERGGYEETRPQQPGRAVRNYDEVVYRIVEEVTKLDEIDQTEGVSPAKAEKATGEKCDECGTCVPAEDATENAEQEEIKTRDEKQREAPAKKRALRKK